MDSVLSLKTVKIIDISAIGIFYLVFGVFLSAMLNEIFPKFKKEEYDRRPLWLITLEIFLNTALITIGSYFIRNMIQSIPSPLEDIGGYKRTLTKELNGTVITAFAMMLFQTSFKAKLEYLVKERLFRLNV